MGSEMFKMGGEGWIFLDQGGGGVNLFQILKGWGEFLLMPHWQTFLIIVIKKLFSSNKSNEFGYIKYELKKGLYFFYMWCKRVL